MGEATDHNSNDPVSGEVADNLQKMGLTVPIWDRPVTTEDIQYFLSRWPFLQILSSNNIDAYEDVQAVTAKTNWVILNYGDAMATSPGEFLFGGGDFSLDFYEDEDDDGEGGIVNPNQGTVWRQAYMTVAEMVALAAKLGWNGIHVVDGHPLMKWATWMHSLDSQLGLSGFEPSERDQERRERVKRSEVEDAKRFIQQPKI